MADPLKCKWPDCEREIEYHLSFDEKECGHPAEYLQRRNPLCKPHMKYLLSNNTRECDVCHDDYDLLDLLRKVERL